MNYKNIVKIMIGFQQIQIILNFKKNSKILQSYKLMMKIKVIMKSKINKITKQNLTYNLLIIRFKKQEKE